MKEPKDITYKIHDNFDHIIDEKGNNMICLRKITWGENDDPEKAKLDLRKWIVNSDGKEIVGKGVSFLTEQGPDTLINVLIENGYGNTTSILRTLSERDDFKSSLNTVLGKDSEYYDDSIEEEYFMLDESEYTINDKGE